MLVFTGDLSEMIDKFLEGGRIKSVKGGFPPVSDSDLEQLYDIVNCLIDRKWDTDDDDDLPVDVALVDRNIYQPMHFVPVMYRNIDKEKHLQGLVFNVGRSIAEMQLYLDLNKIEERHSK